MKQTLLFILLLFYQSITAQNDAFLDEIIVKDNIVFYNGAPFSGNLYEYNEKALTPNKCISKCEYIEGLLHGLSTYWYMNGQLKSKGSFNKGKGTGIHLYYFKDGTLKKERLHKNSFVIKDKQFYKNGNPKYEKTYNSKGIRDGNFITWYENAQKKTEEIYYNGIAESKIKYDTEGVKRLESLYKKGILITKHSYYASGNLKNSQKYNPTSSLLILDQTFFDTTDVEILKQRSYKDEKLHGKQIFKNEQGELISVKIYSEGQLISSKSYKNNKLTTHSEFFNDFKTEKISAYNDNEQLMSESFFTNKAKDSIWLTYLNNGYKDSEIAYVLGKKEWEGNYVNNEKDGIWIHYNTKSLNQTFDTYSKGQKVKQETFEKVHLLANRINQKNTFAYKNRFTDEIIVLTLDDTFSLNDNTQRVKYTLKYLFDKYFDPIRRVSNEPYQLIDKFIYIQELELSKKETIHERRKNKLDKNSPLIRETEYHFYIVFQLLLTNRENEDLYRKIEKINKSDKAVNALFNTVTNSYAKSETAAIESAFKAFTLKRFFRKNFKKAYKENKN